MTTLTSIFLRWILALGLLAGRAGAMAGPTYHVDVDSASLGTDKGYLALSFLGFDLAGTATATVSNWQGDFAGTGVAYGNAAVDFGTRLLTITSAQEGFLFDVAFGKTFSFDVSFDVDTVPFESAFGIALSDLEGNYATGGDLASIVLSPDAPIRLAAVNADFVTIGETAAVPEPSTLLSLFTGIGLLGFTLRRRVR